MLREFIQIRNDKKELVDEIPLLVAGRGRNAERKNAEIKANDEKFRGYMRKGYAATIRIKKEGKEEN